MKFRTEIQLPPADLLLSHSDHILSIGSCFAVNIGQLLSQAKFPISINPLGIVYNPASLLKLLNFALTDERPAIIYQEDRNIWHSFDLHSEFSGTDRQSLTRQIDAASATFRQAFQQADVLLFTFGTAMTYQLNQTGEIVNNCHKYPAHYFEKKLLPLETLTQAWSSNLEALFAQKPDLRILFTVSPVRHVKDTLPLNSVSKSTLRLLCHQLVETFPRAAYFPAFEIMNDDLRDYRYYGEDLIHPTAFAQAYIWKQFQATHMSAQTQQLINRWNHVRQQLQHRPLQPDSPAHLDFLKKLLVQLKGIETELPTEEEQAEVSRQIQAYS